MIYWNRDEAYCCEETAHLGDFAAVIIPPDTAYNDAETWNIQIFDEGDDDAMECGETFLRIEGPKTRGLTILLAETILNKLDAARHI